MAFKEKTDRVKLIEEKYLLLAQHVFIIEGNQHYLSYYEMYTMMNPVLNPETAVTAPLTTNTPAVPNKENEAYTTSVSASSTIKKKEPPPINYKTLITPEEVIKNTLGLYQQIKNFNARSAFGKGGILWKRVHELLYIQRSREMSSPWR